MEIFQDFGFEAAHRLPNVPDGHPCGRMHGHSYRVRVTLRGELDPAMGWLCDYAEIMAAIEPLRAELDHHCLNEIDGLENPTAEIIATWMFERLRARLPMLDELTLRETATTGVTVRARDR
ncbi:MAG: 6-carboxytetrahydropterin synthase QueD [Planctomycetes bacterium]|nr:6-carboxytetrahydropterin synthase QueD [Planctomycetota bacterium]